MILPSKHLPIGESLLVLGGYLLKYLKQGPLTVDQLWYKVGKQNETKKAFSYHGFDNLILALNYLYLSVQLT